MEIHSSSELMAAMHLLRLLVAGVILSFVVSTKYPLFYSSVVFLINLL